MNMTLREPAEGTVERDEAQDSPTVRTKRTSPGKKGVGKKKARRALKPITGPASRNAAPVVEPQSVYDAWRSLVAKVDAAQEVSGNMAPGSKGEAKAMAITNRAEQELSQFHRNVLSESSDIGLLAEILYREMWPSHDLRDADSDVQLQSGPMCSEGDNQKAALAALLTGIRDKLLLAKPASNTGAISIDQTATQIASLWDRHEALQIAQYEQNKLPPVKRPTGSHIGHHVDLASQVKQVWDRIDPLEKVLLSLEPETADEALSLTLVVNSELSALGDNLGVYSTDPDSVDKALPTIEAAVEALIRWLRNSARGQSPLLSTYTGRDDLLPPRERAFWSCEQVAAASAERKG